MRRKAGLLCTVELILVAFFLFGFASCGQTSTIYVCPDGTQQTTPCSTNTPNQTNTPTSVISGNTPTLPPTPTLQQNNGLTPEQVQKWCVVTGTGTCDLSRFEQLVESNGAVNPNGVHMKTGNPVAFNVPAGILVDVWDCFNRNRVMGPIHLPQVCEASFRKTS